MRFIPVTVTQQVDDKDQGTSASAIAKSTPRFYLSRIYGNEILSDLTYENENSALIDGAKSVQMTGEAVLMMELPRRHAASFKGSRFRPNDQRHLPQVGTKLELSPSPKHNVV